MNRALPRKVHVGSESGTGCFDERPVGFRRWAELFRRISVERYVRIRSEVANKPQKLGTHKSSQHKVDPHYISEVVNSPLNLSAVPLSPTYSQAARRRFHWTLIQINAVPVHHATENGARCCSRQRSVPTGRWRGFPPPGAMGDSIVLKAKWRRRHCFSW